MKKFAGLFVGGAIGVILLKLLAALVLPFLGMLIGFFVTAVKVLLLLAVAYLLYSLIFKRRKKRREAEA